MCTRCALCTIISSGVNESRTTCDLVRAVVAVYDVVAHEMALEALSAGALEVARAALLDATRLVRPVGAVVDRVASGGRGHAVRAVSGRAVGALELTCGRWFVLIERFKVRF